MQDQDADNNQVIAAVILHYLSSELTQKCVMSLQNLDMDGATLKVVIVDNASPNGSGRELADFYHDDENVCVIENAENLGFSRANNIGYQFAIDAWQPEIVLMLNNDIEIVQSDFIARLRNRISESGAYIISPDVYVPRTDAHQSPLRDNALSPKEIKERIEYHQKVLDGVEAQTLKGRIKALPGVRNLIRIRDERRNRELISKKNEARKVAKKNVVPSGAALVFTKHFINTGELPFAPATFLYYEEDILFLRCKKNGWLLLYDPELQVLHFHRGATNEAASTEETGRTFVSKHCFDSLHVLLNCHETD